MRERAILREQEHQIAHQLDAAFVELDRANATRKANQNRFIAARERADAIREKYLAGDAQLEFVDDAEQRAVEAETSFFRSQVDHAMAMATVQYARSSYLDHAGIQIANSNSGCESHGQFYRFSNTTDSTFSFGSRNPEGESNTDKSEISSNESTPSIPAQIRSMLPVKEDFSVLDKYLNEGSSELPVEIPSESRTLELR